MVAFRVRIINEVIRFAMSIYSLCAPPTKNLAFFNSVKFGESPKLHQRLTLIPNSVHTLKLVIVLSMLLSGITLAEQSNWLNAAHQQLANWQAELKYWQNTQAPDLEHVAQRQNVVSELRQQASLCFQSADQTLNDITEKLNALGTQKNDEPESIKQFRLALTQDQKHHADQSALCRVIDLASRELVNDLKALRTELISRTLAHRDPSIWQKAIQLTATHAWFKPSFTHFQLWPAALIGLISLIMLYPSANYLSRWLLRHYPNAESSSSTRRILHMLVHRLPWSAGLFSLMLFALISDNNLLSALLLALLLSLLLAPLLDTLLCHQVEKCLAGLPARILLDLLLIGLSLYWVGIHDILQTITLDVLYGLFLFGVLLTAIWLIFAALQQQAIPFLRATRLSLITALCIGPGAYWLGYRALADILIIGIYGSLLGLIGILVLYLFLNNFLSHLEKPDTPSNTKLRSLLGYQNEEPIQGLRLVRFFLLISLSGLFGYWLIIAWNVPTTDISTALTYLTEGFDVGSTRIVPSKILAAITAFFILLIIARWLRKQLNEYWLTHTSLDVGAQQSIIALTTYGIIGLGILLALNLAGVNLQNLAIVAGALSVGIGFGLQNIVNNFVSGLILLFERPVKPGDWVRVGETEGYIKKISIRYTQIQTFDHADVLVPNSELISSPVTNWMLHDKLGRVIVKIGVAYGTNTRRVSEILNQIAREHPFVLSKDPRVPAPRVFFIGFGDNSLDFELRCFIKDIDYRQSVHSDLLFAIDDLFREENIEIPFPQQVVHHADTTVKTSQNERNENPDTPSEPKQP